MPTNKPKHKPEEYLAIALWGKQLGSFQYYIEGQQEKASAEGAPIDAIYQTSEFADKEPITWRTVSKDLDPKHPFIEDLKNYIEAHKKAGTNTK